ncbi:MAG TPA: hypothetical protein VM347_27690 [Nonomuraea sp.]|nr:hypothetical protein [Nonomuraea sp.]
MGLTGGRSRSEAGRPRTAQHPRELVGLSFFKPHNVTLDFTDVNVYISLGKAT